MENIKAQIKAARTLIGMSQADLCEIADIPLITLRRVEGKPAHKGLVSEETISAIRKALESQGIQFLEGGQVAAGPGVALRASK